MVNARFSFKDSDYFFSLDLGRETIKVLIFAVSQDKETKKIWILGESSRYLDNFGELLGNPFSPLNFSESRYSAVDGAIFKEATRNAVCKTIDEAIKAAENNLKKQAGETAKNNWKKRITQQLKAGLINLPADIFQAEIQTYSFSRPRAELVINKKEAAEIQDLVLKEIKEKSRQSFAEQFGCPPEHLSFASYRLIEIKIDGYKVPEIFGYQGKVLEFKSLVTSLPEFHLSDTREMVEDYQRYAGNAAGRGKRLLKVQTVHEAETLSSVLEGKGKTGLFIDAGANWTHVFLVRNSQIEQIAEFESGGEKFSRALSEQLGLDLPQARILKESYSKKLLSEEGRARVREIIFPELEIWFKSLKSKLLSSETAGLGPLLPKEIFLFGNGSELPEIAEILAEGDWEDLIASAPKVTLFYPVEAAKWQEENKIFFEDITQKINQPKNTNLILLCFYGR